MNDSHRTIYTNFDLVTKYLAFFRIPQTLLKCRHLAIRFWYVSHFWLPSAQATKNEIFSDSTLINTYVIFHESMYLTVTYSQKVSHLKLLLIWRHTKRGCNLERCESNKLLLWIGCGNSRQIFRCILPLINQAQKCQFKEFLEMKVFRFTLMRVPNSFWLDKGLYC